MSPDGLNLVSFQFPDAPTRIKQFNKYLTNLNLINMAEITDLAEYRSRVKAPVAGSEALGTALWYRDALAAGAIDYMHYDLGWIGGITEALRISGIAHAHNRMMCPHDHTGPVVWIANLHMSLAFPTAMIFESVQTFYLGFYNDPVTNLPVIQQGQAYPMQGTGLGAELQPGIAGGGGYNRSHNDGR